MKTIIAFLLGYLAANWVASKGGIQQAISSVQTPTANAPMPTGGPVVNSTVNAVPSSSAVRPIYAPYFGLRVFRIQ